MISKKKKLKKKGFRRNPKAFSGRNHKFKRFFRPKAGDLQKQKKILAEIRRLFLAEITNLSVFSGQKQQLFRPKKIPWGGQEINRVGKNENRGAMPPCSPAGEAPTQTPPTIADFWLRASFTVYQEKYSYLPRTEEVILVNCKDGSTVRYGA